MTKKHHGEERKEHLQHEKRKMFEGIEKDVHNPGNIVHRLKGK